MKGATIVIESLLAEGVKTVFGYPGGAIMPVYDALYHYQKELRHILPRHEQGAVHAAEGYARVTRKIGVCMATSGPGALNLLTGIADAQMDSTPLVCITGQVFSHVLGSDAFQETDVIGCTTSISKWNYQISKAEEICLGILGKESMKFAKIQETKASFYIEMGDYETAEQVYQTILQIKTRVLGSEHVSVAKSMSDLANVSYENGKSKEKTLNLYNKSLFIINNKIGIENPIYAQILM